jgi:hypothetical protein
MFRLPTYIRSIGTLVQDLPYYNPYHLIISSSNCGGCLFHTFRCLFSLTLFCKYDSAASRLVGSKKVCGTCTAKG